MQTLKWNEKYHNAGNTIKENIFSTLFTFFHTQEKQNSYKHALRRNFMWTENQLSKVFFKEVIAILFHCLFNEHLSSIVYQRVSPQSSFMCAAQLEVKMHTKEKKQTTELLSWDSRVAMKLVWTFFFPFPQKDTIWLNKQCILCI